MNKIVFYGDSITAGFKKISVHDDLVNLGLSGNTTIDLIGRFREVVREKPTKIFLMIGINDLLIKEGYWGEYISIDYKVMFNSLISLFKHNIEHDNIYLLCILPVTTKGLDNRDINNKIDKLNAFIKEIALTNNYKYIDLSSSYKNEIGFMESNYSTDGIHLSEEGYDHYYELISHLL